MSRILIYSSIFYDGVGIAIGGMNGLVSEAGRKIFIMRKILKRKKRETSMFKLAILSERRTNTMFRAGLRYAILVPSIQFSTNFPWVLSQVAVRL